MTTLIYSTAVVNW